MSERRSVSLMVTLCVMSGSMAACDQGEEPSAGMEATVVEDLEIFWPPAQVGGEADVAFEYEIATADIDTLASQAELRKKVKVKKPKPKLVIGWLRWALGQSYADGPIADQTGEKCGLGQEGPVWYLAGTFGGPVVRECDIPVGKQLFFPLVNRWCVFPEEYYPTEASMIADLPLLEAWYEEKYQATCELTLRIDGQEVLDFESLHEDFYIRVMDLFELDLHEDHWAPDYFAGGIMPAIGDGHYALVPPLSPGDHVIEFSGAICGDYPFETSATYLLHVGD